MVRTGIRISASIKRTLNPNKVAALVYVILPICLALDLIPNMGELDRIGALLLGIAWFIAHCSRLFDRCGNPG